MALMQGLTAAGLSYAVEYFMGYNPTLARSAFAGASGIADYYGKTVLTPSLGIGAEGFPVHIVGAAVGGAAYAGLIGQITGSSEEMTSLFMRGALYAFGSDYLLSYFNKEFKNQKLYQAVSSTANSFTASPRT